MNWVENLVKKGILGFNPTKIARAQEERQAILREERNQGNEPQIRGQLTHAITRLVMANINEDTSAARSARKEIERIVQRIRKHNESAKVEDIINIDMGAIKRRVILNMNPHLRAIIGMSRQKVPEHLGIQKTYAGGG